MSNNWIRDYVQQRINEARREMYEPVELDAMAERIARRVAQGMTARIHTTQTQSDGQYVAYPKRRQVHQGMYSDELLRQSGLYEREWRRLHGEI